MGREPPPPPLWGLKRGRYVPPWGEEIGLPLREEMPQLQGPLPGSPIRSKSGNAPALDKHERLTAAKVILKRPSTRSPSPAGKPAVSIASCSRLASLLPGARSLRPVGVPTTLSATDGSLAHR
jgi:hypothetical protein